MGRSCIDARTSRTTSRTKPCRPTALSITAPTASAAEQSRPRVDAATGAAREVQAWFVQAPERPVTFRYTEQEHRAQGEALRAVINQLEANLAMGNEVWPLTDNLSYCRQCAYRVYCGRAEAAVGAEPVAEADWWLTPVDETAAALIEPDWS